MERKKSTSAARALEEQPVVIADERAEVVSVAQIQRLVRLLDRSDVSELELKRPGEGIHLVLRKAKASEGIQLAAGEAVAASTGAAPTDDDGEEDASRHSVVAPLVGVFHPWLKARGSTLAAVGDHVKVGQLVGTIESLNVFNEVETAVAGRVVEIHVVDGQPVEYGQPLLTIEVGEVENA